VDVVLSTHCAFGAVYTLCRWCYVHMVMSTCYAGGVLYMLCRSNYVNVVLCKRHTCCVVHMGYCVICILYSLYN